MGKFFGAGAIDIEERIPIHRLKGDLEAGLLELRLDQFVHRQGLHLARARGGDAERHLARQTPGFAEQRTRLLGIVVVGRRMAVIGH